MGCRTLHMVGTGVSLSCPGGTWTCDWPTPASGITGICRGSWQSLKIFWKPQQNISLRMDTVWGLEKWKWLRGLSQLGMEEQGAEGHHPQQGREERARASPPAPQPGRGVRLQMGGWDATKKLQSRSQHFWKLNRVFKVVTYLSFKNSTAEHSGTHL